MINLTLPLRIISSVVLYFVWSHGAKEFGWGYFEIYLLTMVSVIFVEVLAND